MRWNGARQTVALSLRLFDGEKRLFLPKKA
jgi:hypothetical protein